MFSVLDKAGAVLSEAPSFEDALRAARLRHPTTYDRVVRQADGAVLARALRGDMRRMPPPSIASAPPTAAYGHPERRMPSLATTRPAPVAQGAPAGRNASVTPEAPPAAPELTPASRPAEEPAPTAAAEPPPHVELSPLERVAQQLGPDGRTVAELVAMTGLDSLTVRRSLLALWDQLRARVDAGRWSRLEREVG